MLLSFHKWRKDILGGAHFVGTNRFPNNGIDTCKWRRFLLTAAFFQGGRLYNTFAPYPRRKIYVPVVVYKETSSIQLLFDFSGRFPNKSRNVSISNVGASRKGGRTGG